MKGKILDLFLLGFLVVCAADLIYLYFAGAWYDILLIEVTELIFLVGLIVVGIARTVVKFRDLRMGK